MRLHNARADRILTGVVLVLELVTIAILAVLVLGALAGLIVELVGALQPPFLGGQELAGVLDSVLALFVLIELLISAIAYVRGTDVLRRIFEAVFVAIARKVIALDVTAASLTKAGALALLLVATAVAALLVARSRERRPPP